MERKVSLIPTKIINIEFENVSMTVSKGKKQIIRGVSGQFNGGQLSAIMGPSGAGKTTLLNILTGFQNSGVKGIIKSMDCDGLEKTGPQQYKKDCSYILQDDQLTPLFSVQEIMHMASELKLGRNMSEKTKQFIIDEILETLGLLKVKNTRCEQLSGGQRKRLSIALELINNTPIMFLDEPTTGLDSLSSSQCIRMLKKLAQGGRTIICTIHQPSASIFALFDYVFVMAAGSCIYQGASMNAVNYLSSVGLNCPKYHNPADYLLEVASKEYGDFTELLAKEAMNPQWRNLQSMPEKIPDVNKEDKLMNEITKVDPAIVNEIERNKVFALSPSEVYKFSILVDKAFTQIYRDWTISHLKLVLHFVVGLTLGSNYYKTGNDASKTLINVGYFMCSIIYLTYTSLMPAILKFPSEMKVLKKERYNNWYNLKTYYLAFLVSDIPLQFLGSLIYVIGSYFLSDQPRDLGRFMMVLTVLVLTSLTASSFGLLIGTTAGPINGTFFGAVMTAVNLILAGFFILFSHMSAPLYILSFTGFMAYAFPALLQAVYGYDRPSLPCPEEVDYCQFTTPELILRELGIEKCNYWHYVGILVGYFVTLRVIAYFTLKRRLTRV